MSEYSENLLKRIIDNSNADNWDSAVLEWDIIDSYEQNGASCVCGKEHILYCSCIQNMNNGNIIEPIGSTCIKKFKRSDLNEKISINEKLFQLLHATENNKFIKLKSNLFSRKLLKYFYDEGVFTPNNFNGFDPEKDYNFILDMYNKRTEPSQKQQTKINAIIMNNIKPYLDKNIGNKIRK